MNGLDAAARYLAMTLRTALSETLNQSKELKTESKVIHTFPPLPRPDIVVSKVYEKRVAMVWRLARDREYSGSAVKRVTHAESPPVLHRYGACNGQGIPTPNPDHTTPSGALFRRQLAYPRASNPSPAAQSDDLDKDRQVILPRPRRFSAPRPYLSRIWKQQLE